jgi:hypothetical protein
MMTLLIFSLRPRRPDGRAGQHGGHAQASRGGDNVPGDDTHLESPLDQAKGSHVQRQPSSETTKFKDNMPAIRLSVAAARVTFDLAAMTDARPLRIVFRRAVFTACSVSIL